jgi:hypothetical protein
MVVWPAGTALREVTRLVRMPVVTVAPVHAGDMLAEVRYSGAVGSFTVPVAALRIREAV